MKTPFIPKLILLFILFFLYSAGYAQQRDSVTIRGQVTDYNGQPIDSCSIFWQSPSFDDIKQAITDKNGYYTTRIPKGKYQSMGAINMSTYPHTVKPGLAEKDQRLEFWAWNFIADRDTTLNIRYHRMEVYGLLPEGKDPVAQGKLCTQYQDYLSETGTCNDTEHYQSSTQY